LAEAMACRTGHGNHLRGQSASWRRVEDSPSGDPLAEACRHRNVLRHEYERI